MKKILYLKRSLAIAQKLKDSPSEFGEGHNLKVEVGFFLPLPDGARDAFKRILDGVDHRALGRDIDLGFEPTTPALVLYLAREFERELKREVEIRLQRGDFSEARNP